ncbi:peptidylprolyl isomerase [Asticcacaulis excentricus]|uniref:peptidylprolyl isomerase n=1 Tax=Asticcacaulis excentricus (strain ATCC 15261 / DSM 4724 / KCTC 12464 / NCIMB 9791 / VKM B-1370 / CB 48) TaxID=573065 RepID=E8RRH1_ASTEC|nr:peptidylprolyl isomerase [Asticcacaulis excentricus]ADU13416.1 peptidyl-prolyl cis-trans isomerase cyclophilin type [Asticcacaulis excentricus CB 48]
MKAWGAGVIAVLALLATTAVAQDWTPLDADNTLILETTQGRVIIALSPQMAPQGVARIKQLTRQGFYNGLLFHRVIDHFVAQTGNPDNKDGGRSALPDLPLEAVFRLSDSVPHTVVAQPDGATTGFMGAVPYVAMTDRHIPPASDGSLAVRAWGTHCRGVLGMGRGEATDSANSELYLMRDTVTRLDRDYTVVGRVVSGFDALAALKVGEPSAQPDAMNHVRLLADMPAAERPKLEIMNITGAAFAALVKAKRAEKGADFSVCDITVPVRTVP